MTTISGQPAAGTGNIVARVKGILTSPKTEWPVAAAEPATIAGLYTGYIVILAAITPLFHFIKGSLIGYSAFGITVRTPIGAGITGLIVSYVLSLVLVFVMALIIEALAPTFGGQKDRVQALKTVAYAYTAYWVAGVAAVIPWLGFLIMLAGGIYTIYLLYLGLPFTMKCPTEKSAGYTAVSIIIAIVLGWIISLVVVGISGAGAAAMHASGVDSTDSGVSFDKDSALGKMAAFGARMDAANKQMEQAQKSGDAASQQEATAAMMGAALGGDGSVEALAPAQLKQFVPDSLGGMQRTSISAERNSAMGMQISEATADYSDGAQRSLRLEITDTGGAQGLMGLATAMAGESEKETATGYDRTYKENGNLVHEQWDRNDRHGTYGVTLASRFTVEISGSADSIDQLKSAANAIDLTGLASAKSEGSRN